MKRKLLFAIVALMCSVGTWAGTDVTSKYLTNPSFESGNMTGWTAFGANNNDTPVPTVVLASTKSLANYSGSYVCNYQWWCWSADGGTPNGISQTISSLPAGSYQLTADVTAPNGWTVYLYANSESSSATMASDDDEAILSVCFTLANASEVTVKAIVVAPTNEWQECTMVVDNFKLYRQTDVTSTYITNANFSSTSGWTSYATSGYRDFGNGLIGTYKVYGNTAATVDETHLSTEYCFGFEARWSGNYASYNQTTSELPAGHYELSYDVENVNSGTTSATYNNLFYVKVGENTHTDSNTEWMKGKSSWTKHTISFDIPTPSTATISLGYGTGSNNFHVNNTPYLYVSNLSLDYTPFADSDDYTDLSTAIAAVEGYTLGFDDGEYAPYTVLPILNAAKAIDQNANNSQATVREIIDALNGITANATEVNAIAYGDLSSYETVEGKDYPWGWSKLDDGSRIMGGSEGTENAGLSALSTGKAMLVKYNAYYGRNEDYIMPLKANTYYTLSFKYCGWQNTPDTRVVIKDSESQALTFTPSSFTPETDDGYSNAAHWYEYKATFKTNDAGNYSIELNKVQSGQQQIAWADMNLVRATASEIRPLLNSEIIAANETYNSGANVGEGVFQIPESAGTTFSGAISDAQDVYDDNDASASEITDAIEALKSAVGAFKTAELNAPAAGQRYYLKVATSGHPKENNAIVVSLGATGANNKTGYGFSAAAEPVAYMAQALIFTKVSGNTYNISVERPEGTVYLTYGALNGSEAGWKNQQIQGTTEAANKGEFKIEATPTANVFKIFNIIDNNYIDCQDGGALYTDTNIQLEDFTIAEASQASVTVSCKAGKFGTTIVPFTVDITEFSGIKFYTVESVNATTGKVQLTDVTTLAANVPYLIKNEGGENFSKDVTGWGTATADSYTVGLLTGVYTAATIPASSDNTTNYVLQTQEGTQAFYKVGEGGFTATAYKCYLTVTSSNVKAFFLDFGGEDAINGIEAETENAEIFNLAGQRVNKAQRGIYIVNGKKVLVK